MLLLLLKAWILTSGVSMASVAVLLVLLYMFLRKPLQTVLTNYELDKILGFNRDSFDRLVVCSKCNCVRKLSDCVVTVTRDGRRVTTVGRCSCVHFRKHPHKSKRTMCNAKLCHTTDRKFGLPRVSPVLSMPYRPLLAPLARLLQTPGFENQLEQWRVRFASRGADDPISDIHDGQLWRDMQSFNGAPLLAAAGTIAMCMWGDWIQPFVTASYSMGVIMMVVGNLPRSVRFKRQNVILVQLLPGGSEKVDCQALLRPLAEDLLALRNGVNIATHKHPGGRQIRVILFQCLADAPGIRKLLAFVGITATCGCYRCTVQFPPVSSGSESKSGVAPKRNFFTDFDNLSPSRTREQLFDAAKRYRKAKSPSERKEIAKETGSKDCVFLMLDYFNPVRASPIGAMHNLWEGTAKVCVH